MPIELDSHEFFLNRELTWLSFNSRVLHEAADERNPLLERLKFLAIVSSNLDEFFMKRIGSLKRKVAAGILDKSADGLTAQQQIDACYNAIREQELRQRELLKVLREQLAIHNIKIVSYDDVTTDQGIWLREYFYSEVFPLITPQSFDPSHPFPFISNYSLNLLVKVKKQGESAGDSIAYTRIKMPLGEGLPRFVQIPDTYHFLPLEELVKKHLYMLLPQVDVEHAALFRVTRNIQAGRGSEETDDLLAMIQSELRDRHFASIVRVQVQDEIDSTARGMLAAELGLDEQSDVFSTGSSLMALRDLFEIAGIDRPELQEKPFKPLDPPQFSQATNIFHAIRNDGPFMVHHPYDSFKTSVERFLKEAAHDPKVKAIKMTLYRTSSDTKVVDYLIQAAQNRKQVAVVVELKASFDEAANIRWATRLEEAGVHVTYGVIGLKTHSKITLVVRKDYNGLQRYLHIGTGNYHAGTARLYTDLGILTNDKQMGIDATELFNYLTTGFTPDRFYRELLPAPKVLKSALLARIEREIKHHTTESPGLIQFKVNALEDADITKALYRACQVGVQVNLIVRDSCRFLPGIPGVSENATVISIVGRFLEHARIYYFKNNGDEEYLIGSADAMQRNLESRVEVVAPVKAPKLREELRFILDTQLNDYRQAWDMRVDGTYVQRQPRNKDEEIGCHQRMIDRYTERNKKAKRFQTGKTLKKVGSVKE
ncbi:MAG: polyphosphate kinase 1 [Sedimenticolaceae bacterium]